MRIFRGRRTWGSPFLAAIALPPALVSCTPERFDEPICRAPAAASPDQRSSQFAQGYFPPEFGKPSGGCGYDGGPMPLIGEVERDWYPRQLRAASESSFFALAQCESPPEFALRFSYIPSFNPSVFVRVQPDAEGVSLVAKRLTGAGGYEPGSLGRSKMVRLTPAEVERVKRAARRLFQEPRDTCEIGFDGSQWLFEMVDEDGYRFVKRWSPDDGAAHDLGRLLIELSGWNEETY